MRWQALHGPAPPDVLIWNSPFHGPLPESSQAGRNSRRDLASDSMCIVLAASSADLGQFRKEPPAASWPRGGSSL